MVCVPLSTLTRPARRIILGIAVALFSQCIGALINPINTVGKGVRWWLVAHTVALFLFSTAGFTMNRYIVSTEYIDNRDFPGTNGMPPGPIGYENTRFNIGPFEDVYTVMFPLNQWLADGLLVSSILKSAAWVSYVVHSSSYIVAISFFL